jgi:hypothetical protein
MAKKYHLDSVAKADGTVSFTLVFEDPTRFFVEERHEPRLPDVEKIIKNIPPSEFGKHHVNGVSLIKLVAIKLGEGQNFN